MNRRPAVLPAKSPVDSAKVSRAAMDPRRLTRLAKLFVFVGVASCEPAVRGSITTSGPVLGAGTVYPDGCTTGDVENFLGVDVYSSRNPSFHVRVIKSAENGLMVDVDVVGQKFQALRFREVKCRVLQASFRTGSKDTYGFHYRSGSLDLDCASGADDNANHTSNHIEGHLDFNSCGATR